MEVFEDPGKLFGDRKIHGLREMTLSWNVQDTLSLLWLSEFARRHPLLKKIIFDIVFDCPVPFVDLFIEKARGEGLDNTIVIRSVAVTRAAHTTALGPFTEWYVWDAFMHLRVDDRQALVSPACVLPWNLRLDS